MRRFTEGEGVDAMSIPVRGIGLELRDKLGDRAVLHPVSTAGDSVSCDRELCSPDACCALTGKSINEHYLACLVTDQNIGNKRTREVGRTLWVLGKEDYNLKELPRINVQSRRTALRKVAISDVKYGRGICCLLYTSDAADE